MIEDASLNGHPASCQGETIEGRETCAAAVTRYAVSMRMHTSWTAAGLGLLASTALAAPPQLRVSSLRPKPGDPVVVTVVGVHEEPKGTVGEAPLVFFPVRTGWQ